MKKLIILSCLLAFVSNIFGQVCNPNPAYTAEGFNPTEFSGLAPAFNGIYYEETITLNLPVDTTLYLDGVGTLDCTLNWLKIDSIRALINGNDTSLDAFNLSYSCSPSQCQFSGGSSGCILISGVPTLSDFDNNNLVIYSTMNVTNTVLGNFDVPQTTFNYIIDDNAHTDVIRGKIYQDENQNCVQDISEMRFSGVMVVANPGNNLAMTDYFGNYTLSVNTPGIYTVTHIPHQYWSGLCPQPSQSHSVNVSTQSLIIPDIDFGDTLATYINDLQVIFTNITQAKPGFPVRYNIFVRNLGTTYLTGTLQLQHDAALSFVSSNPIQDSYTNNMIVWNYGTLNPNYGYYCTVDFVLDSNTPLGTQISSFATANPTVGDTTPWDNSQTLNQIVQGSFDPNIKVVSPHNSIDPLDAAYYELTYTVHFQNTGTDTAINVIIRDTISDFLNMETFEVLASSHPVATTFNNPREIIWRFNNIMLPDSNANELASHGFVKYRIRVNQILEAGQEIRNTAHIYFDFNEPITTNTVVIPIAMQPGFDERISDNLSLLIFPNPNSGSFTIESNIAENGKLKTEVRNLFGQLVYAQDENAAKGLYRKNIDVDLAKGIYLITLQTNEGRVTKKIEIVK
jgi:hypothetical protein